MPQIDIPTHIPHVLELINAIDYRHCKDCGKLLHHCAIASDGRTAVCYACHSDTKVIPETVSLLALADALEDAGDPRAMPIRQIALQQGDCKTAYLQGGPDDSVINKNRGWWWRGISQEIVEKMTPSSRDIGGWNYYVYVRRSTAYFALAEALLK